MPWPGFHPGHQGPVGDPWLPPAVCASHCHRILFPCCRAAFASGHLRGDSFPDLYSGSSKALALLCATFLAGLHLCWPPPRPRGRSKAGSLPYYFSRHSTHAFSIRRIPHILIPLKRKREGFFGGVSLFHFVFKIKGC